MEAAQYNFNIYNSLILAGIVQGLVFGAVVAFSKKYRDTSALGIVNRNQITADTNNNLW